MADIKNIAGRAKDILVGNNIKQGRQGVLDAEQALKNTLRANRPNTKRLEKMLERANEKANADDIAFAQKQLKNIRNYNVRAMDNYSKAKKNLAKERLKTYGTRAGVGALAVTPGAVGYGVYKHNKNKKEKTALDIVVDAFEKNAGFREDVKNLRTAQKAYKAVKKEKGVVDSAREQALRYAKAARDTAFEDTRKSGVNAVKKRAVPIAVGAGAVGAGAGAYGIYRHNKKKKEEKTAYDIVVDAFEKMATEE